MMNIYTFKPDKYSSHMKIINFLKSLEIKNKIKILDIGCSKGFMAENLMSYNFEFYGIDINKEDVKFAKKYYKKIKIIDIDNENLPYKNNFFDIIIMGDIIEHLKEPLKALKNIKNLLKRNGIIIISTPNIANIYIRFNLLCGNFEYTDRGILDKTHLRFFTLKTFRQLVKESHLKIINENFTPIPLPMINNVFSQGKFLNFLHKLNHLSTCFLPKLFSFQFILYCKKCK